MLDAFTGSILQTLTHADMGPVAASPTVLTDVSGYIERGYVGDLQGNVWRVTVDNTGTFSLGGAPFFRITGSGYSSRIYTKPAVAKGAGSYPYNWVYFGTGDRDLPMDTISGGAVFGVFDSQPFSRRGTMTTTTISDVTDLTVNSTLLSSPTDQSIHLTVGTGKKGWYAVLPNPGEKALTSPPAVFNGNLFFTTFQPLAGNCSVGGTARVYGFRVIGNDDALGAFALYSTVDVRDPGHADDRLHKRRDSLGAHRIRRGRRRDQSLLRHHGIHGPVPQDPEPGDDENLEVLAGGPVIGCRDMGLPDSAAPPRRRGGVLPARPEGARYGGRKGCPDAFGGYHCRPGEERTLGV